MKNQGGSLFKAAIRHMRVSYVALITSLALANWWGYVDEDTVSGMEEYVSRRYFQEVAVELH